MNAILAVLLAAFAPAASAAAGPRIDDTGLTDPRVGVRSAETLSLEGRREDGAVVFPLSSSGGGAGEPGAVTGRVLLPGRDGALSPARLARVSLDGRSWTDVDAQGRFRLAASGAGPWKVRVSLDNRWCEYRDPQDDAYQWESAPLSRGDAGDLFPAPGSEHAKLALLHRTCLQAIDYLAANASLDWWKTPLPVTWPAEGSYYVGWTLHVGDAQAWDVVLHELGHAVMYGGAMDAHGEGGEHFIDRCYSDALAWSEGWASFFAASAALSPDDPDARFQYMVPRRAPIRVENVPGDVCQGTGSEWRVFAGLWDLHDTHVDGLDRAAIGFPAIWKAVTSGRTGSVLDAWRLISARVDPLARAAGEDALRQNTLLPAAAPADPAVSLRAPLFDGR